MVLYEHTCCTDLRSKTTVTLGKPIDKTLSTNMVV